MIPMMLNYTKNNNSSNSLNNSNSLKPQAISTTISAEEIKRRRSSSGMQSFGTTQKIFPSQNLPPYLPSKITNNPSNILSSSIGFNRTNTNGTLMQINSTITTSPQRMRTSSIDSIFLGTNRPATIQQFFQPRNPIQLQELIQSPNLVVSNPHANSYIDSHGIINQNSKNNTFNPAIQILQRRSSAANAPQQIIPSVQQSNLQQQQQQKQSLIQQQQLQLLQSTSKQHQLEESLKKQQPQYLQESSQKKVSSKELSSSTDLKNTDSSHQQQQQPQQLISSTENLSRNLFGPVVSQNSNYQQQQQNQQYKQIIHVNSNNNAILRSSIDSTINQQQQQQQQQFLQQLQQQQIIMTHSSERFASNPVKVQFAQSNGVILKQVNQQPQFKQVLQTQQQQAPQQFQSQQQQSRQDLVQMQQQQSYPINNSTTPTKQPNHNIPPKSQAAEAPAAQSSAEHAKNLCNAVQTINPEMTQKQAVNYLQNADLKLNQPQATIQQRIAPSKPAQPPSSIGLRQTDPKQGQTTAIQHNRQSNSLDAKGKQSHQQQQQYEPLQKKQEQQSEQLLLQQESQEHQEQQQPQNQHEEVFSSSEKQHSSRLSGGNQTQQEQTQESSKQHQQQQQQLQQQQQSNSQLKQPEMSQNRTNLGDQSFQEVNQADQDNYRESQILSELRAQREQSQQLKELLLQSSQKSNHEQSRDLFSEQKRQSRQFLNTSGPELLVQRLWCSEEKVIELQSELEVYKQKLLTARIENERQERKSLQVEAETDRLRLEHERLKEDYEILKIYNEKIIEENDRLILQLEKQYQHQGMIWPVQQSSIQQNSKVNPTSNAQSLKHNQNTEKTYSLRKEHLFAGSSDGDNAGEMKRISRTGYSNQENQPNSYYSKNNQNLIQPVRFLRQPEGSTKQQAAAQFLDESPEKQQLQLSPQRPLPPLPNTNLSTNSYTINYTANNNNSRTYTAPSVVVADGILQADGESRHSTLFSQLNDSHFSMPPTPEQNLPLFKYQK